MGGHILFFIYKVTGLIPALWVFAIIWFIWFNTWLVPILCLSVSALLLLLLYIFVNFVKMHVSKVKISAVDVGPMEMGILKAIAIQLTPLIGLFVKGLIDDGNLIVTLAFWAVPVILNLMAIKVNVSLLILGYKYYVLKLEEGTSNNILITKQNIRRRNQIAVAKRFYEYFYMAED